VVTPKCTGEKGRYGRGSIDTAPKVACCGWSLPHVREDKGNECGGGALNAPL